jgi:hypothetical protein
VRVRKLTEKFKVHSIVFQNCLLGSHITYLVHLGSCGVLIVSVNITYLVYLGEVYKWPPAEA